MSIKIDNMLNIGSIVKTRTSIADLMVIGYTNIENDILYDYIGCPYPVGIINSTQVITFNNDDIEEVVANGYSNGSEQQFKENYLKALSEMENYEKYENNQKKIDKEKEYLPAMFDIQRLLPIGAVVKVAKDNENKYMITSNLMEKDGLMYDYMAAKYPIGIYSLDSNCFFNDDDITDIYFFGYSIDPNYIKKAIIQNIYKEKNIHIG